VRREKGEVEEGGGGFHASNPGGSLLVRPPCAPALPSRRWSFAEQNSKRLDAKAASLPLPPRKKVTDTRFCSDHRSSPPRKAQGNAPRLFPFEKAQGNSPPPVLRRIHPPGFTGAAEENAERGWQGYRLRRTLDRSPEGASVAALAGALTGPPVYPPPRR
jgi:hypothetical protein